MTTQIITALEEEIKDLEALGQDVKGRRQLLAKLKAKDDPVWRALGGKPEDHPLINKSK
jgi:hypothetical protein